MNGYCDAKWFFTVYSLISNWLQETLGYNHNCFFAFMSICDRKSYCFFVWPVNVHTARLQVNQGLQINV